MKNETIKNNNITLKINKTKAVKIEAKRACLNYSFFFNSSSKYNRESKVSSKSLPAGIGIVTVLRCTVCPLPSHSLQGCCTIMRVPLQYRQVCRITKGPAKQNLRKSMVKIIAWSKLWHGQNYRMVKIIVHSKLLYGQNYRTVKIIVRSKLSSGQNCRLVKINVWSKLMYGQN